MNGLDKWSAEEGVGEGEEEEGEVWESRLQGVRYHYACGPRDVLIIRSSESLEGPGIVRRRKGTLTVQDKMRLTSECIQDEFWEDDVQLMEARYGKEERFNVLPTKREDGMSRHSVMGRIRALMNNTKRGAVLHYIGPGKKDTGDWCFADGFITFGDIIDVYRECFESKCLEITSDCSYSGKWVSACRDYLNETGVKACGHSAWEKKILLKVKTSCRSNEVPHTLLYSARGQRNDKNTGKLYQEGSGYRVELSQHLRYLDNTAVRCQQGSSIEDPCAHAYDWHKNIQLVRGTNSLGHQAWYYVLVEDEDRFHERSESSNINVTDHGTIWASGEGQDPPKEVQDEMKRWYSNPDNRNHYPS